MVLVCLWMLVHYREDVPFKSFGLFDDNIKQPVFAYQFFQPVFIAFTMILGKQFCNLKEQVDGFAYSAKIFWRGPIEPWPNLLYATLVDLKLHKAVLVKGLWWHTCD